MDFFGNVQNVEVQGEQNWNETAWREDLEQLEKMIQGVRKRYNVSEAEFFEHGDGGLKTEAQTPKKQRVRVEKLSTEDSFKRQAIGVTALLACLGVWIAASWFDSRK